MLRSVTIVAALTAGVRGQAVHRVGPGGFAEIHQAIAAASPGDVIEVAVGNYQPFTLAKALTITALPAPPGNLVQVMQLTFAPAVTELRPPAGTTAYLTGIHFRNMFPFSVLQQVVRVTSGTVCFEECTLEGAMDRNEPALNISSAAVLLRHCLVRAWQDSLFPAPGVQIANGSLFATDCVIAGGTGNFKSLDGANGLLAVGSVVHLVRTDVFGGDSDPFAFARRAGHAVVLQQCQSWLADCNLTGGNGFTQAGGDGLVVTGPLPAIVDRVVAVGGAGTPAGRPIVGVAVPQILLGLGRGTDGLVRGQPWTADYRTGPQWPIVVVAATDIAISGDPRIAERLLLPPTGAQPFALLTADAGGAASLSITVPNLAALQHRRVFLQAFSGASLPLRTQPALGGVIR